MVKHIVIKCLPLHIGFGFGDGMKFWCPFCNTWHLHGRGNGHRTAHCTVGRNCGYKGTSPYLEHGYFIKLMSKTELKQIRNEITAYLGDAK